MFSIRLRMIVFLLGLTGAIPTAMAQPFPGGEPTGGQPGGPGGSPVCLTDPVGASASFYDTQVNLIPV